MKTHLFKLLKKVTFLALTLGFLFSSYLSKSQFQHPGIYSSKAELEFVKQKINQGQDPWKTAFDRLKASNPTSRTPKAWVRVPGSSDPKERKDMDAMTLDGAHAYASALLFYFTGEKRYADYTIDVLNKWSIFEKIGMPLYLTWGAPYFLNAAELMKHTPNSGWKQADIDNFSSMVNDHMWNIVKMPNVTYGSNHAATAIESQYAIAIFLDDQAKFDKATENMKWLIPRYIFLNRSGRLDGESNETCRDLNHTKLGTDGIWHGLNSAYHQGLDLWEPNKTRFTAFARLHAGMISGDKPVPSNICAWKSGRAGQVFCKGSVPWSSPSGAPPNCDEVAWEILYNHLGRRLGVDLPSTLKMLNRNRPKGSINKRTVKWETLLHANINPADIGTINTPEGPEGYVYNVDEKGTVSKDRPVDIAYGVDGQFIYLMNQRSDVNCSNTAFGSDPKPGVKKHCFIRESKTSYHSSPVSIPGILEAEYYNYGGNGVSYMDLTEVNSGASQSNFRVSESVDIAKSGDVLALGWTQNNEWTEYDLDIEEAGNYQLTFNVSARNAGGKLALYLDNNELASSIEIPSTGSYDTYEDFSQQYNLPEGRHILRLKIVENGFNLDKVVFEKEVVSGIFSSSLSDNLDVYPNPASDGVFHLKEKEDYELRTVDGYLILSGESDLIDISSQPKGIYLLKIRNESVKLIK